MHIKYKKSKKKKAKLRLMQENRKSEQNQFIKNKQIKQQKNNKYNIKQIIY